MLACDWLILNLAQPITIMTRIALCVSDETEITVLVLINCTSSLFGRRNMFRYDYLILLNRKHANRPFLLHVTRFVNFQMTKNSAHGAVIGRTSLFFVFVWAIK